MKSKRIASIGECMIELSDIGDNCYRRSFAGDTLNVAVYLARGLEASGHRVSYVTALGKDPLSDMMLAGWKQEGIECDHVARIPNKLPGLYSIQLSKDGERSFCYWRNDSAARKLFDHGLSNLQQDSLVRDFDILYLSGITLAILDDTSREHLLALLIRARRNNIEVVFDNNYRSNLWPSAEKAREAVNAVLKLTTVALVTFDDEKDLFGDTTPDDSLKRMSSIPEVVVKNGADGCLVHHLDTMTLVPSKKVIEVTDTTAAGDSFNGSYLAARIRGASAVDSAGYGHAIAATVIQYKGAIIPAKATASLVQHMRKTSN